MKNILRYFVFIAIFFISQQLMLTLLLLFIKDFYLSFFLSKLLTSFAVLLVLRKLNWLKLLRIKKVSIRRILLYIAVAFAYGAIYQLLYKNTIGFNFNKSIYRILSAIIIAPIIEEIIFRSVAIEYLIERGVKKYIRIIFTTLVFGLIHLPFYSIFHYHIFLFGIIVALIYEKERNVVYGIAFHAIVNIFLLFY